MPLGLGAVVSERREPSKSVPVAQRAEIADAADSIREQ
jgi:hypothetical protein